MDTCEFVYISRMDSKPKHVVGIEQSWEELKRDLKRSGSGYPNALYYKTISPEGPQLFAVVNEKLVLYHENEQWHQYITACNVKFGFKEIESNHRVHR